LGETFESVLAVASKVEKTINGEQDRLRTITIPTVPVPPSEV
jgi:hypothetical protein